MYIFVTIFYFASLSTFFRYARAYVLTGSYAPAYDIRARVSMVLNHVARLCRTLVACEKVVQCKSALSGQLSPITLYELLILLGLNHLLRKIQQNQCKLALIKISSVMEKAVEAK